MKRIILIMMAVAIGFASCNKDNKNEDVQTGEIKFTTETLEKDFNKDGEVPQCELDATYAKFVIDGDVYTTPINVIDGMTYTQVLKLDVGEYTLEEFSLWSDMGTPEDATDDLMTSAAVHTGGEYEEFVTFTTPYDFTVAAFVKTETHVEVLCVEEGNYTPFGFQWFSIWETVLIPEYFFGDLCIICLDDYESSLYANQAEGVQIDVPAIFYVELWRDGIHITTESNAEWFGEGEPLCIYRPDRVGELDEFEYKVFVLVSVGDFFEYVYQYSLFTTDDVELESGADNVNEFVLGECQFEGSETNLPQWYNLPPTVEFTLADSVGPAPVSSAYFDMLVDAPAGYIITDGNYGAFCLQNDVFISLGTSYTGEVVSSIAPATWPAGLDMTVEQSAKLNYMVNSLGDYGIDINNLGGSDWEVIQAVIWHIMNGTGLDAGDQTNLAAQVDANYFTYVSGLPNDATKLLVFIYHSENTQLQIINVDPCLPEVN